MEGLNIKTRLLAVCTLAILLPLGVAPNPAAAMSASSPISSSPPASFFTSGCTNYLTEVEHGPSLDDTVYQESYDVYAIWKSPPGTVWCGGTLRAWVDNHGYTPQFTSINYGEYKIWITVSGLSHGGHRAHLELGSENVSDWQFQQIRCGMNQLVESSTTGTGTVVEAVFTGGSPDCQASSSGMTINGNPVQAQLTKSGTTYTLRYEPDPPLGGGNYQAAAWVRETCCRPDGTINQDDVSWSWDIPDCGSQPLVVVEHGPTGYVITSRPAITVRFLDTDITCDLLDSGLWLDGEKLDVEPVREGSEWVFTYHPPTDLLPGNHVVRAYVKEGCCNAVGASNEGNHEWSFVSAGVSPGKPRPALDVYFDPEDWFYEPIAAS